MMMQGSYPTGLYLFTGTLNREGDIGHIYVFIKGSKGEYYFCDLHKEVSQATPLPGGDFFSGLEYKVLYGTFMYPFSMVESRFQTRLKEMPAPVTPAQISSSESKSVSSSSLTSSSISILVGSEGPGLGLHQVTTPTPSTVSQQDIGFFRRLFCCRTQNS